VTVRNGQLALKVMDPLEGLTTLDFNSLQGAKASVVRPSHRQNEQHETKRGVQL
jgi:hypothetical protein